MMKKREHHPNFAFWIITIMHDNPLLPLFKNPYKLLKTAGLEEGQKVLEVGCGPGFFTIPAAKIVGDSGLIFAVDVHPLAIKRVQRKIEEKRIKNVKPILVNASDTSLPDQSIDLAFVFGLGYIAGGLESLIKEMHRIIKPKGILSFEKTRGPEQGLIQEVQSKGFIYSAKQGRIFIFTKKN